MTSGVTFYGAYDFWIKGLTIEAFILGGLWFVSMFLGDLNQKSLLSVAKKEGMIEAGEAAEQFSRYKQMGD